MLKIIKKALGAVLEVAGVRVPGATEGQTLVANAEGVFVPGAGGGGGGPPLADFDPAALGSMDPGGSTYASRADHVHPMPAPSDIGAIAAPGSPTDGGVLARVAGAWVSTGAGSVGQHLKSNGSGAPTWETPAGGADTPPTGAQWYDAMKIALATPSALGGDYTTGIRFRVLSDRSITGAKFYWAGSATSLLVKVWQAGVEIASKSVVASGGAGDYTALFSSPVALVTGTTYTLSIYDTSTAEYTANSSSQRQSPEFGAGWVRLNGYAYAGGDAEPTSGTIISNVMLLAPLF